MYIESTVINCARLILKKAGIVLSSLRFPFIRKSELSELNSCSEKIATSGHARTKNAGYIVPAPRLLDVSASQTTNDDANANVASPRRDALKPAAFPDEGAEIDDAPGLGFDATPDDDAPLAPASFDGAAAPAPSSATFPASETASSDLAPSEQDARRSATKPRGAKYVRVPEVEIDAYSGGVRAVDASRNETRVVGATRARQTLRVPAPAP